jgi:hypothetical protein
MQVNQIHQENAEVRFSLEEYTKLQEDLIYLRKLVNSGWNRIAEVEIQRLNDAIQRKGVREEEYHSLQTVPA